MHKPKKYLLLYGNEDITLDVLDLWFTGRLGCYACGKQIDLKGEQLNVVIIEDNPDKLNHASDYKVGSMSYLDITSRITILDEVFYIIMYASLSTQFERQDIRSRLNSCGFKEVSLIADTSVISSTSIVNRGCLIGPGVYVGPRASLGNGSIVLFNTVISRFCKVGSDTFISANCTLTAGRAVGQEVFIGAASTIDASIQLGSIIGSCSSIKKTVESFSIIDTVSDRLLVLGSRVAMQKARLSL